MSLYGRSKMEVFENDYVTGIGMSQFHLCVMKTDVFLSVFGGQVWMVENASVDEKLFMFSINRKRRFSKIH